MKKKILFGAIVGLTVGAAVAGTFAVKKVAKEMKEDVEEQTFLSPDGDHAVTLTCGTSVTAKGLTRVQIEASADAKEDTCKLLTFAMKRDGMFEGEWTDNDHFQLLIGCGKRRQCCEITFVEGHIAIRYYLNKKV